MLSYMLPVDEKPPPGPTASKGHLQLSLAETTAGISNGRRNGSPISKDASVNSFVSDTTATASQSSMTPTSVSEKSKPKLIINGGKHQSLKRVSFGSSKGSMVETLIFESPVQEESEPSPVPEKAPHPFPEDHDQAEAEREKVRVTFFQQSKPQEVDLPDEPILFSDSDFIMASGVLSNDSNHIIYNRTESVESGWENPFRPGGDLSREADEIVELIKGGKPITPTSANAVPLPSVDKVDHNGTQPITQSPKKATALTATPNSVNGNVKNDAKAGQTPGSVDVKRGTVKPDGDGTQVEHVTIKKKPKCKCCVIQ